MRESAPVADVAVLRFDLEEQCAEVGYDVLLEGLVDDPLRGEERDAFELGHCRQRVGEFDARGKHPDQAADLRAHIAEAGVRGDRRARREPRAALRAVVGTLGDGGPRGAQLVGQTRPLRDALLQHVLEHRERTDLELECGSRQSLLGIDGTELPGPVRKELRAVDGRVLRRLRSEAGDGGRRASHAARHELAREPIRTTGEERDAAGEQRPGPGAREVVERRQCGAGRVVRRAKPPICEFPRHVNVALDPRERLEHTAVERGARPCGVLVGGRHQRAERQRARPPLEQRDVSPPERRVGGAGECARVSSTRRDRSRDGAQPRRGVTIPRLKRGEHALRGAIVDQRGESGSDRPRQDGGETFSRGRERPAPDHGGRRRLREARALRGRRRRLSLPEVPEDGQQPRIGRP